LRSPKEGSLFLKEITMYAVIQTGGKQYKVAPGQKLKIEKLEVAPGDQINFDKVLLVSKDDGVRIGVPLVEGATVSATVLDQGRHKKIKIIKFKRRAHYDRQYGHRQAFTEVEITGIN
jgi:large subunit ribosomal protein L21